MNTLITRLYYIITIMLLSSSRNAPAVSIMQVRKKSTACTVQVQTAVPGTIFVKNNTVIPVP